LINQQQSVWLPLRCLHRQVSLLLTCAGYGDWDVGVHFTTDAHIQRLNKQYRLRDSPTDILSFPFHSVHGQPPEGWAADAMLQGLAPSEGRNLGDMFLSMAYVLRDCKRDNEKLTDRLPILFTHGICHLLGYDHVRDDEYRVMSEKEASILKEYRISAGNRLPF
ncbi:hypothetical protein LPJ73_005730, partial [Coemansia sp. RSA 2703]